MQLDRLGNDMSDDIADALAEEQDRLDRVEAGEECDHGVAPAECLECAETRDMYGSAGTECYADELTGWEEHERDSQYLGDPRRCPRHPHVKTSSDDGMFDAPCGLCEAEQEEAADQEWQWSFDQANPQRKMCTAFLPYFPNFPHFFATCQDVGDNIPF